MSFYRTARTGFAVMGGEGKNGRKVMAILGASRFDQCVVNMSLINMCDQESYVGQELVRQYGEEAIVSPWSRLNQFTIFVPHPDQEYEGITLEDGLNYGYNVEVQTVEDKSYIPYNIPAGGHFVVVLKQAKVGGDFKIAATGVFIRPLGVLSLDLIVDEIGEEYQPIVIKHPIIREYPGDWQDKLSSFIKGDIDCFDLPNLVNYVDRSHNQDYRPPSWHEVYLSSKGFVG